MSTTAVKHAETAHQGRNLTASIGKSTVFGVLASVTQVGTRLVTVPVTIHYLGLGGYGIWNVIMMTATYMRFGSVGVKTAFQKYVAEATVSGDYKKASTLLSTGSAALLVLSLGGLIPVAYFSLHLARAAGTPQGFLSSTAHSISMLAVIMVLSNVGAAYEAIVMGGHRIDLVRQFTTVLTVIEAVAIIVVLHLGLGLFAMASIMGCSELAYVSACYFAARRVVPEVRIGISFVRRNVLHELFRYAGSYQLVNILEVLYNSIVPFAILRTFGANSAGVYAVVTRIVASAAILQDAFLGPILSGATAVFASGSSERMQRMLTKSFKVTLALALFPLGFVSLFGPIMARAWTGEVDPSFHTAFWLVCLTSLFRSFSLLSLVLYRVSGKALLDNIRQVLRIVVILTVALFAPKVGFYGVLAGLAFAELSGMIFMLGALMKTFDVFHVRSLVPDTVKLAAASVVVFGAGTIASQIPLPLGGAGRQLAVFKLLEISFACLFVAWPSLRATGSITAGEGRELLAAFRSRRGLPVEEVVDGGNEVIAL